MKKIGVLAALLAIFAFSGVFMAQAGWDGKGRFGPGFCNGPKANQNSIIDQEAFENFQAETETLRQQLFEKRSEYFAAMNEETPDKEYAALIWSEMFDIREQIREKAEALGIDMGPGMGGRAYGEGRPGKGGPCGGPGAKYCWKNQEQDSIDEAGE